MGAVDDGVLQDELVIALRHGLIVRVLQAQAAELAGVVFEQGCCREGRVAHVIERGAEEERAGIFGVEAG